MRVALGMHEFGAIGDDAATGGPVLRLEPKLDGQAHGADHEVLEAGRFADFAGEFDGGVRMIGGKIQHLVAIMTAARDFGLVVRKDLDAVGPVDESERGNRRKKK